MTGEILEKLQQITPEEQRILSGEKTIEKEIYMEENSNVIDATKLLEAGKLIQVRTHTRFIHFPEHTHNYVEMISEIDICVPDRRSLASSVFFCRI